MANKDSHWRRRIDR